MIMSAAWYGAAVTHASRSKQFCGAVGAANPAGIGSRLAARMSCKSVNPCVEKFRHFRLLPLPGDTVILLLRFWEGISKNSPFRSVRHVREVCRAWEESSRKG